MPAAYRLEMSAEQTRQLDSFPPPVRDELRLRIENSVAFPVSSAEGTTHDALIRVEGYFATLRLDAAARTVTVVELGRREEPA